MHNLPTTPVAGLAGANGSEAWMVESDKIQSIREQFSSTVRTRSSSGASTAPRWGKNSYRRLRPDTGSRRPAKILLGQPGKSGERDDANFVRPLWRSVRSHKEVRGRHHGGQRRRPFKKLVVHFSRRKPRPDPYFPALHARERNAVGTEQRPARSSRNELGPGKPVFGVPHSRI